jgi:hypothetical protein
MPARIPRIEEFPSDDRIWRLEWFGAVERTPAEARIEVLLRPGKAGVLRPRDPKQHFDAETRRVKIGVGQLPFLTVGSLWRNKRSLGDSTGDELKLPEVKINAGTVRLIRAETKLEHGYWAVPPFALKIEVDVLPAKCLAIEHGGDPYAILLPVAEAIRFYYAASTDLAHITFSGGLQHSPNEIYDVSLTGLLRERNRMVVRLRQWLADDDAWIIGRSLASPVAAAGMARVYDSLVENSVNQRPMFPECGLPFEGTTRWKARCKTLPGPVPGSKRFLIFELLRCTASFPFDELEVMRTNDSTRAPVETDLPEGEKRPGWAKVPSKPELSGDEELQSTNSPNASVAVTQIPLAGERFAALAGRRILKTLKEQCRYKASSFVRPAEVDSFGTGEADHAEGPAVGPLKASLADVARQRNKGLPASLEMLETLVEVLNDTPRVVAELRPASPGIAVLPPVKPRRLVQWSYLSFNAKKWRQVAIVDIRFDGRASSFVEFELRPSEKRAAALLCSPTELPVSDYVVGEMLKQLARARGVWANIPRARWVGVEVKRFNHSRSSVDILAAALLRDMCSSDG